MRLVSPSCLVGAAGIRRAAWLAGLAALAAMLGLGVHPPCPAAVPPGSQMQAEAIVSGRTSTQKDIQVAAVGNEIPATYSGSRLHNTEGFSWYVSRHYALKTDYDAGKAELYLRLLEMAYPHYVELFGAEPEGIDKQRMAVVYASSIPRLKEALASDGIAWNFGGGGITFEGYRCAYQYPSGSLQYHQRYILLHECTHLFQMCLTGTVYNTPSWYYEGIADLLANHVWDEHARRLTVNVVDKATTNNPFDQGLSQYRLERPAFSGVHAKGSASRGIAFLMAAFFLTDPDRCQRLRIYRDEMFRRGLKGDAVGKLSEQLLLKLLGPWPKIDGEFRKWVEARRNTFHYAEWGWEQDSNTLWSYGFAPGGRLSRTDVCLPPGEAPRPEPLRMDYPAIPQSPLVGQVERGGPEPAVGAVIDFSRNPASGTAGVGLGLIEGEPILPFAPGMLFTDEAGTKPGLNAAAYHKGMVIDGGRDSKDLSNGDLIARGVDAAVALGAKGSASSGLKGNFVVQWDGWLKVARAGEHELALASDDGSWLWIDGREVVNNGGFHAEQVRTGKVSLPAGMHRFRLRYFQGFGDAVLKVGLAARQEVRPGCLRLLVQAGKELDLDGTDLGLPRKLVELPEGFRRAMAAGGHGLGLNARIAPDALVVTLRARDPKAKDAEVLTARVPIDAPLRKRLLTQSATILARGGYHGVTPFFDPGRGEPPADLDAPAPPNRWRNPGDPLLYRLYRAEWRLGDRTPPALRKLKAAMLAAVDKAPPEQTRALADAKKRLPAVLKEIGACVAPGDRVLQALGELQPLGGSGK